MADRALLAGYTGYKVWGEITYPFRNFNKDLLILRTVYPRRHNIRKLCGFEIRSIRRGWVQVGWRMEHSHGWLVKRQWAGSVLGRVSAMITKHWVPLLFHSCQTWYSGLLRTVPMAHQCWCRKFDEARSEFVLLCAIPRYKLLLNCRMIITCWNIFWI